MNEGYNALAGGVSAWGLGRMGAKGGFGSGGVLGSAPMVWRGLGHGMSPSVQGFNGTTSRSRTTRTRHYSQTAFRKFRIAIPVFQPTGTPIADALFSGNQAVLNFQIGLEYPYTLATSGLAARVPVTFNGANYVAYDNGTWDAATGYILSDIIDLGYSIPANTYFGLWFTCDLPSGFASNSLPYTHNGSSFINRYGGVIVSTSSQIAALGGSSDVALAATSVTAFTSSQGGASNVYMPCMMLVQVPASTKSVFVLGDSKPYGVGEGVAGSDVVGDSMGNAGRDMGYVARGLAALGLNYVNFGRGSDGTKYMFDPNNWKYRRQLMALANPTHIVQQNVFNDMANTITINNWAATTAYSKYDVYAQGGVFYYCTVGGTSGSTNLSSISTTPGATISDGQCTWYVMGGSLGGSAQNGTYQVRAWLARLLDTIRLACPNIPIIQSMVDVSTSSTDSFATLVNQTILSGFAVNNSRRHYTNLALATPDPLLGTYRRYDPSALIEDSYPTESAKWVVNGAANYLTFDGTHPNSVGAELQKGVLTAGLFV